jgi:CelD/BcsL family acetyltransferase involved in cellulose biosynthesis
MSHSPDEANRGASIETQELKTTAELEAIRPEWKLLWANAPEATPFQSPDWLMPCWNHFGSGTLSVLALRLSGRLVGLIPWTARADGNDSERKVTFIGEEISDYLDGLFEAGLEHAGVERSMNWLQDLGLDACNLTELRPSSPFLSAVAPADWYTEVATQNVCPVLRLPNKPAELDRFVPARQLKKLRYYRARAHRQCGMEIECAREENFPALFQVFLQLHSRRWAERGQCGVLADPSVQNFHFEAAGAFLRDKVLRLYVLHLGAKSVGALYVFVHRRRAYYYLAGFDPEFKVFSPGMLLVGHAIDQAILEGAEEFDFLRGREPYKYGWGAADRATFRRTLFRGDRRERANSAVSV